MTIIEGDLVRLRPIQKDDWPVLYKYRSDLETHMLADDDPPMPRSYEFVADFWEDMEKKEPENVWFGVEADDHLIGSGGLFHFNKTARSCELGIAIGDKAYWGKGYGSEASRLLVDFAFRHLNQHRVMLMVRADNERAVAAYRKIGFVEEGRMREDLWVDGAYRDSLLMSVLEHEWGSKGEVR